MSQLYCVPLPFSRVGLAVEPWASGMLGSPLPLGCTPQASTLFFCIILKFKVILLRAVVLKGHLFVTGCANAIWLAELDYVKYPRTRKTSPATINYPAPDVNSPAAEKPALEEIT